MTAVPRVRRLLAVALPLILAALLAGVLVARALLDRPAPVAQDRPGPVLLVPGFGGGTSGLGPLAAALQARGRQVSVLDLPGDGTGDLRMQAEALDRAVDRALRGGAPAVDLVGYSAGGVVVRLWAGDLGGAERARRIVSLAAPQHGTNVADLAVELVTSACPEACRQLVSGSPLLRRLDAGDETPPGPRWLAVWSADDEVVTPPSSARLAGATNVELQDVCPSLRVDHGGLPGDPLAVALTLDALGAGPVPDPGAADCAALTAAGRAALSS